MEDPLLLVFPAAYHQFQPLKLQSSTLLLDLDDGLPLGAGSYGIVFRGRWRGALVAVKKIKHEPHPSSSSVLVAQECITALVMAHPNHVRTYFVGTALRERSIVKESLQTSIVMDFCDMGTLREWCPKAWNLLRDSPQLGWKCVLRSLQDIARGMAFMHSKGLILGDLKCDNLLRKSTRADIRGFILKISDLGGSRLSEETDCVLHCGNPYFAAPELLERGEMSKASDVYAFAIISWHLVSHGDSFYERNLGNHHIAVVESAERPAFPATTLPAFAALVQCCWHRIPSQRPSFLQILIRLDNIYREINDIS